MSCICGAKIKQGRGPTGRKYCDTCRAWLEHHHWNIKKLAHIWHIGEIVETKLGDLIVKTPVLSELVPYMKNKRKRSLPQLWRDHSMPNNKLSK
jgi:hypothetical protein